jgi:hypothetical protein
MRARNRKRGILTNDNPQRPLLDEPSQYRCREAYPVSRRFERDVEGGRLLQKLTFAAI